MLDRALKIDPSNWNAWFGKGKVWGLKGSDLAALDRRYDAIKAYETALAAYEKAIGASPGNSTLWLEKGIILKELDRKNEGIRALDKSIEINPNNTRA